MKPSPAPVTSVRRLCADVFAVWLRLPTLAGSVRPGQFVNVEVPDREDLLLRRPISVADVDGDKIRLVFRVLGSGTAALARARVGDEWNLLGPLGRAVRMPRGRDVLLVGGGVGSAPLLLLAKRTRILNRVRVFIGARTAAGLLLVPEFRRLGVETRVATDDGSRGYLGTVTELAESEVEAQESLGRARSAGMVLYACGPLAMLADMARRFSKMEAWGFFEERMGCGTGICYCCALRRRSGGYVRFCKEGPVVKLADVDIGEVG